MADRAGAAQAYALKAAREAAVATTWRSRTSSFETALREMVDRIYDDASLHAEVADFAASITPPGWSNSLGQKLMQLTMPGVPDVYQGTELWDHSLVNPDKANAMVVGPVAPQGGRGLNVRKRFGTVQVGQGLAKHRVISGGGVHAKPGQLQEQLRASSARRARSCGSSRRQKVCFCQSSRSRI